jgi:DNA-binding response OmpR family regulator
MPADQPPDIGRQSEKEQPTILIIEDEVLLRVVLSDYLQECGYKVLEATTAEEAVLIIRKSEVAIDLVFTDIVLPGSMDGFGLTHWIRANRPGLPVILTSGDDKKVASAKELCENAPLFSKPYDLSAVVAQMRATINSARTQR